MVDGLLDVLKKQRDSTVSSNEISGQVKTHERNTDESIGDSSLQWRILAFGIKVFLQLRRLLKREEEHLTLRGQARHIVIFCYAEML